MKLEYKKILKQAYQLTKTHKFLWLFGLFLFWGNAFNLSFSLHNNNSDPNSQKYADQATQWLQAHTAAANWIGLGVLFLFFVLVILYFWFRAGLLVAAKAVIEKKETSFRQAFKAGGMFYRRILWTSILVSLGLFALGFILATPTLYLLSAGLTGRGIILVIIGLVIFLPVLIAALFTSILAPIFIVYYDQRIDEALKNSLDLVTKYWPQLMLFGLFLAVIFMVTMIVLSVILGVFVLFAVMAYHKVSSPAGLIFAAIPILIGALGSIIVLAAFTVFQQLSWVLVFEELIRPVKVEEEKTVPLPEVAN